MIDLASLPEGFLSKRKTKGSLHASFTLPDTLRALFDGGYLSLGELTLFDDDLIDQFNVAPAPLPEFLQNPSDAAERLLADVYGDHRLEGSEGMFFFASDIGGVIAYIDETGRLGRGAGAIFAVYPGDGGADRGDFVAGSFDELLRLAVEQWKSQKRVDLRGLAGW
ncbi:MAG: hypothetical protein ACXWUG_13070 [Polyangiales bacterium]